MKNSLLKLFVFGAVALVGFSSCSKDDSTTSATLTLLNSDGSENTTNIITVAPGATLSAKIRFKGASDNTGKTLSIDNNILSEVDLTDDNNYNKQITFDYPFTYTSQEAKSIQATVKVTTTGQSAATELKITINFTAAKAGNEQSLGNQKNDMVRFWASADDKTYTIQDAKTNSSKIDLGYVTRTAGNKIIAPNSTDATDIYAVSGNQWSDTNTDISTWATKNATLFKKAKQTASGAFASANGFYDTLIATEKADGEPTLDAIAVTAGDVIFFKTAAGKYGFVVVSASTGTVVNNSATSGSVTFKTYYQY